jgi:hypothetical protein
MATRKDKTPAAPVTPAVPATNTVDLTPQHAAWQATTATLNASKNTNNQLHLQLGAIGRWMGQECEEIAQHIDAMCKPFIPAEAKRLREELETAKRYADAARFIDAQLGVFRVAREADRGADRDALLKEATGLQASGHAGLVLLVLAGLMSEAEARAIRKGRGALDCAQDCQRMGIAYTEHWTTIEPAIKMTRFIDVEPLTLPRVQRMAAVGDALAANLQRAATNAFKDLVGVDWSHQRAALLALIPTVWEPLRLTALLHATRANLPDLSDRLLPIASMRTSSALYR